MSYPTYVPAIGHALAEEIGAELRRAEGLFPDQTAAQYFFALVEEVGEVGKGVNENESDGAVCLELIQVAVCAIAAVKAMRKGGRYADLVRWRK